MKTRNALRRFWRRLWQVTRIPLRCPLALAGQVRAWEKGREAA